MSLWAKAQQLPGESIQQIKTVYGEHFPIEVRHCLAAWIEERFWYVPPFIDVVSRIFLLLARGAYCDIVAVYFKISLGFLFQFYISSTHFYEYIKISRSERWKLLFQGNNDIGSSLPRAASIRVEINALKMLLPTEIEPGVDDRIFSHRQQINFYSYCNNIVN